MKRYLYSHIAHDLKKKMVFVAGPRQVGKTTLSQEIARKEYQKHQYLNWDVTSHRKKILAEDFQEGVDLVIFDEIHKYPRWKNYMKGQFDNIQRQYAILVTGSARLNVYRKGGDSMMGRYWYYHLHPFSLREALQLPLRLKVGQKVVAAEDTRLTDTFQALHEYGGFPESFLARDGAVLRRLHDQRREQLIREDIRDTTAIRSLSVMEQLVTLLPSKVSSLLSLHNLAQDLEVAHKTLSHWMDVLENFYYHFRLRPFHTKLPQTLRKDKKLYLWDWSEVSEGGKRLENMVASHLLKMCHFFRDVEGYRMELWYLRDRQGREIDFLVTIDQKPWMAVEVKSSRGDGKSHLDYFGEHLNIPHRYLVVDERGYNHRQGNIVTMSVENFLGGLV